MAVLHDPLLQLCCQPPIASILKTRRQVFVVGFTLPQPAEGGGVPAVSPRCPRDVPAMSPRQTAAMRGADGSTELHQCGASATNTRSVRGSRRKCTEHGMAEAASRAATGYSSIQSNALQWYCLHFSCPFEKEMLVCRARSAASLVQIHAWSTLLSAKRQGFASSCYISLQSPHIFHTSD